ncbi:profilin [Guyanagaster necrorhizus]|uniref:Profilin n=1 Tax=Guyanagaster necrorhizus TaxID=856835 RepID=A0A9P8ARI5_9AGAR|nr:profilin [Guyanagaster necrorhizus MCA 3950]KAG7445130.1 profilin [Guyanagaster necrorhizus MCA 3950]
MSWQAYVDTNLVGSGRIAKAAIIGQQGGIWAASAGYNLSTAEQNAIIQGFSDLAHVQASGIRAAGQKFFTLQANERSIYGKKAADGIVIVKTKQAILVAEYIAPIQAPEATPIVEGLADYLISVGY